MSCYSTHHIFSHGDMDSVVTPRLVRVRQRGTVRHAILNLATQDVDTAARTHRRV